MADRSVKVTLRGDISDFNRAMVGAAATAKVFTRSLDTSTDRMQNLVQTSLALGPALVPIGAAAIPAVAGLTNQLAFASAGAGVAAVAFQGVGDALDAVNDYSLEPTTENFGKMQQALATLGPAGQHFVQVLQELRPEMQRLQDVAQEGLFPGLEASINDLMSRLPQLEDIVSEIATAVGDLMAEAGDNLADPRWNEFFDFLEEEARPTLMDLGRTIGNFAEGFANLWMAFDPVSDNFSNAFLQLSRDFATWTDSLSESEGFQEFVNYISEAGPMAWEALGAIGNALVQLVEAAAPIGSVALPIIEALADTLAAVADSPAGPVLIGVAAGISALSRAVALYNVANGSAIAGLLGLTASRGKHAATTLGGLGRGFRVAGAGAGTFALAMTDVDDKIGLSNTAMGATMGLIAGPWGAAIGAATGLVLDLGESTSGLSDAIKSVEVAAATGDLEAFGIALRELNDEIQKAEAGQAGFGQKIVDSVEGINGAARALSPLALVIDQFSTSTDEAGVASRQMTDELTRQRVAEAQLTDVWDSATASSKALVDSLLKQAEAKRKAADETWSAIDAEIAWEQAVDDATETIKRNGQATDLGTQKGRENIAAIGQMVESWNNLTPASQKARGGIEAAREAIRNAGRDAGASKEQIRDWINDLADLSGLDVYIPINADTAPAEAAIDTLIAMITGEPTDVDVGADTNRGEGDTRSFSQFVKDTNADIDEGADTKRGRKDTDKLVRDTNRKKANIGVGANTSAAQRAIQDFFNAWNGRVIRLFPFISKGGFQGRQLEPGFALGGVVPGRPPADPTLDNVRAVGANTGRHIMVRSGEWIINEPQSRKNDAWLRAINSGLNLGPFPHYMPHYAQGGIVGARDGRTPTAAPGVTINQYITTHETQDSRQVANVSANRVLFAMKNS